MMIRGVTISMRLEVVRPMPTLRKRRFDQRGLGEDGHAELAALLVEPLDAAEQDGAAVGDGDGRRDGRDGEPRELDRALIAADPPPRPPPPTAAGTWIVSNPSIAVKNGESVIRT